ncbi:MAG: type II 3-dehydroquinate dehydratase [Chloroflexi bacterium]|jgi:3-dehydroquinate dehydratase II|nr:type II 3-dehydroquinate dehydratase [Chloroflexota bacterium]MBT4003783.1 type II 3-dehydroquinate dehydratase [Chloroflexota bacterium]MBT4305685.1 type II 3-dehydroquinate dehydratase [Chloroflexota bacterium]MBT4533509.1 type II 3-dehydroquinate dehydratase [Chloroflexota bacterium]MBT4681848.1 type II 3-dehydroquinate dehydratase [Chloroflexota bacterium]
MKILILHGPNLNLLGTRETDIYGKLSLVDINLNLEEYAKNNNFEIKFIQSNIEGELVNALQEAQSWATGVVFNPAGYTHTSVALRDAITAIEIPVIEVHLSNVYGREEFRQKSLLSGQCAGKITGFGWRSYLYGLMEIIELRTKQP